MTAVQNVLETAVAPLRSPSVLALRQGLAEHVRDLRRVIDGVPLAAYSATPVAGQSSIGAHIRHILDFMTLLAAEAEKSFVDYEGRKREASIERDPALARLRLDSCAEKLYRALGHWGHDHRLTLHETPCLNVAKIAAPSSLGREILYLIEHGTHHLALIKLLAGMQGLTLDADLGVAVATRAYQQSPSLCAAS